MSQRRPQPHPGADGGAPAAPERPAPPAGGHHDPAGLTVAAVVHRGAVVGIDDSDVVRALLDQLVAASPSLVATASLPALLALVAARGAREGELRVRLFGGEHRAEVDAFTGPRVVRGVTAARCDVALVGGRLLGVEVWVPDVGRAGRLALLLAARRTYLALAADDRQDGTRGGACDGPPPCANWTRLAALTAFDGVLEVPHPAAA